MSHPEFKFSDFFDFGINLIKYIGIKLSKDESRYFKFYGLYSFIVNGLLIFIFTFVQVLNLYQSTDLRSLAATGYVVPIITNTMIKGFLLYRSRFLLQELFLFMDDNIFKPKNELQTKIALTPLVSYSIWSKCVYSGAIIAVILSLLKPR